jgi:hypothetical protein
MKCGRPEKRGKNTKKKHEGKTAGSLPMCLFLAFFPVFLGLPIASIWGAKDRTKVKVTLHLRFGVRDGRSLPVKVFL